MFLHLFALANTFRSLLLYAFSSLKKLLARFVSLLLFCRRNMKCLYMHTTFLWSCTAETIFSCNKWQTCSGLVYNCQDRIVSAHMYVIEHWLRANLKVVRFSIARLEFSLLYLPYTFDSFYALPNQKYRPSSFSTEQPLHQNFTFTGNHATELKRGNPERTSVNTDIRSWTMGDIWSEKNVGFIGPVKFLSDLTVGPTYFAKSANFFRTLKMIIVKCGEIWFLRWNMVLCSIPPYLAWRVRDGR